MKLKLHEQIKRLEDKGYLVDIHHVRQYLPSGEPKPTGGFTLAEISYSDPNYLVSRGVADCSVSDNYNRRIGGLIALGRAIKKAGISL